LLGAWWGQVAWSNYWGWDPKENWAFITWLIFSAYLHFRNLPHWSKKKGLQFSIVLQTYYLDKNAAEEQMAALPAGRHDRAKLISTWNGDTLLYADPYLAVR
jgi:hypothetical protein